MAAKDNRVVEIASTIERYLMKHPHAVDTAQGIADWWLADEQSLPIGAVESAIACLVEKGRLLPVELPDGALVYARPPPP